MGQWVEVVGKTYGRLILAAKVIVLGPCPSPTAPLDEGDSEDGSCARGTPTGLAPSVSDVIRRNGG